MIMDAILTRKPVTSLYPKTFKKTTHRDEAMRERFVKDLHLHRTSLETQQKTSKPPPFTPLPKDAEYEALKTLIPLLNQKKPYSRFD